MKAVSVINHIAYTSQYGIALKVYNFSKKYRQKYLPSKWMIVISYIDSVEMSDGVIEVSMTKNNILSALEIGRNTNWDCLLIKKI